MFRQAIEPTEFVVELGPRRRIAIGEINAADDDVIDPRLDVAAVRVFGIAGQAATTLDRFPTAREDRDAIPAFLAMPDWASSRLRGSPLPEIYPAAPSIPEGTRHPV